MSTLVQVIFVGGICGGLFAIWLAYRDYKREQEQLAEIERLSENINETIDSIIETYTKIEAMIDQIEDETPHWVKRASGQQSR